MFSSILNSTQICSIHWLYSWLIKNYSSSNLSIKLSSISYASVEMILESVVKKKKKHVIMRLFLNKMARVHGQSSRSHMKKNPQNQISSSSPLSFIVSDLFTGLISAFLLLLCYDFRQLYSPTRTAAIFTPTCLRVGPAASTKFSPFYYQPL